MNITRRTRSARRTALAAALALVPVLGLVSAAPAGQPAPVVLAGGAGHCC